MARSHHRKKHKTQLQQFKHSHDNTTVGSKNKTRASSIFAIAGALVGSAVAYFATGGAIVWIIAGLVVGTAAGYLIGKRLD